MFRQYLLCILVDHDLERGCIDIFTPRLHSSSLFLSVRYSEHHFQFLPFQLGYFLSSIYVDHMHTYKHILPETEKTVLGHQTLSISF